MAADINPSMTVYEIDAKVRENGKRKSIRVTDDEYRIINAYIMANETVKDQVKKNYSSCSECIKQVWEDKHLRI